MNNPAPPSTSLVAGKYQLVKMIGRGGMGSVWEGRHVSLGTRVAIKFIEKEYAESAEARKRFDNEAHAAARIQSKYAIQIHDHGITDDGKPFIVMEYLEGEPLDKRLERLQKEGRRMPLAEVARMLSQVARALGRAHENHIVHRDLKPENIFLVKTPDDDDEIAKVLDFGIAKIRGTEGQALSNSTKTGAVLGTPYYMSPEQARGLRDIDHRTDLWSLGVIVFKCATGVLPFDGESLGDLLVKICTSPLPVPSHVAPGLPAAFDAWFARALDRDPNNRFATAQEMSEQLSLACGVSVRRGPVSSGSDPNHFAAAKTSPSNPPPGFVQSSSGVVSPYAASGRTPSGSGPVPAASGVPNVTAVGLSASASGQYSAPKKGGALKWVLAGVGAVLVGGAVVAAAFLAGERAKTANAASAAAAGQGAPAISIQLQAPQVPVTVPPIATPPPIATAPTPPATATVAEKPPTTKTGSHTKPSGGTTTTKPAGGTTSAGAGTTTTKPAGGTTTTKAGAGDPGF